MKTGGENFRKIRDEVLGPRRYKRLAWFNLNHVEACSCDLPGERLGHIKPVWLQHLRNLQVPLPISPLSFLNVPLFT